MLDQDDVYHLASLSFGALSVDTASPSPPLGLNTLRPCSSTDVWAGLHSRYPLASPVCKSIDWFHTWSDSSRSERSRLEPEPINRTSPIHTLKMWIVDQNLSCNRITGPVPSLINRLNQLLLLDLSYNRLSGSFPSSLQGLSSFQALVLKGNAQFDNTGILDSVNQSPGPLHLEGNNLTGSIPMELRGVKHLREPRLNDNRLTWPVLSSRDTVWRMRRKLRLYNCKSRKTGLT
uniref:Leucine-rich repeat-containing N-terminal plant-type domain-containing protein n=1 Tax=Brassica oleracea var. oleracea TaxID=109376 RepID=A0A0D3AS07_BRAOL